MNGVALSVEFNDLLKVVAAFFPLGGCVDDTEPSQLQKFAGQSGGSKLQLLVHQPSRTPEKTLTHSFFASLPVDNWFREVLTLRSSMLISIVKSSDDRPGAHTLRRVESIDVGEVGGKQKHPSGHISTLELHWALQVAVLMSTTVDTHTTDDDAGSSACGRGTPILSATHSMA